MKMWFALVPVALTAALLSNQAVAGPAGTAEAGAAKSAVCAACHGANGNSVNPEWPNLAAQGRQYLVEQLAAFKSGVRVNALMSPLAMPLSEQDMADLAAYFHAQTPTGGEADPALVARGQQLYRAGDPSKGLPGCIGCHGPEGRGNAPAKYPAVRGQHATYAYNQLKAYAAGTRYVPPAAGASGKVPAGAAVMNEIAGKLSDDDMKALASYLQGLR
jgi:cytochrome c553